MLDVRRLAFVVTAKVTAMNWEMISAVGQMLGAVGVIISIIYLAAQIRNQNQGKPARGNECSNDALERFE
jgi:heme/copper-type cytochrome/quinol oxidase subunit 1